MFAEEEVDQIAAFHGHDSGILRLSVASEDHLLQSLAEDYASRVLEQLDYVGVLTLEFFATVDGPVFNEMAPRVHNSGHWTIEGAVTSQFENHVRAICGLPLGDTGLAAGGAQMRNLIGADAHDWQAILSDPAYMNSDWDGISIVINVEPGHTSMNGYVYSGDDWEGSLPDENGDDLINLAADLQDVMAAEVGKRWVQALVQLCSRAPQAL